MSTEITKGAFCDTQVSREVQRQSNQLGELRELVDRLEARLGNVIVAGTAKPETETEPEPEKPTLVPLAAEIAANNDGAQSCILKLCSLCQRIEL
ncbi:hypothetical protein LCGC14_2024730 [marine sediment metagenome]|uniref:Uncharacterized protein n=1 Tax=marine sediment metagenome TaxID=412755 RepID=A0A0F9FJ02_9ZZZZ